MNRNLRIGYQTHVGMVRSANQDNLFVDGVSGLFIVADGMGGHNAGEVASDLAVREVSKLAKAGLDLSEDILVIIEEALLGANEVIWAMSEHVPAWKGMGTTVVVALFRENLVWIGHVGDSRAYLIRSNDIIRLTEDHSLVAQWVAEGLIAPDRARFHPMRHVVSMALGTKDGIQPAVSQHSVEENDCILLCSDGLTEMLADPELLSIVLKAPSPEDACKRLVERANQKGGTDNITCVVVCCD